MTSILIAIGPIFILIVMGYGLRRGGIPSTEFWNLNDRLVYWVLMPALFFVKISAADLTASQFSGFTLALYGSFACAAAMGWLLSFRLPPPVATSVIQGGSRFNSFIALAVAEALFGTAGLQIAVLGTAVLVPFVNVVIVATMTRMLSTGRSGMMRGLVTNPLILSIAAGAAFNLAGLGDVPVLHDTARLLGAAALPIMLLCVGANLKLRGLEGSIANFLRATVTKFVVSPAICFAIGMAVGLDPLTLQVALIIAALPAGVATYTLARQLGGDASLMATIITAQTLLSFLVMPLTLILARALLGLPPL